MAVKSTGYSVKSTSSLKIVLLEAANPTQTACEIKDPSIRSSIVNQRKIKISSLKEKCPSLAAGNYKMLLVPENASAPFRSALFRIGNVSTATIYTVQAGVANGFAVKVSETAWGDLQLKAADDDGKKKVEAPYAVYDMNQTPNTPVGKTAECDLSASPLIVQLSTSGPKQIQLTAPLDGILFDILGRRSFPRAHTKKQISWLTSESARENYFIVLPNREGRVNGVDQMFGDNTSGPDKKFASNGYEALRKWDGRKDDGSYDNDLRDGFITEKDSVYASLRFWSDKNANGVSEHEELFRLSELDIERIDLNYDPDFEETDSFGNKIKMKSVVTTHDGKMHLMYDIWFRLP